MHRTSLKEEVRDEGAEDSGDNFFNLFHESFRVFFSIFLKVSLTGLISMLANFRRPTSSVFGLFTQPEVREVVYEAGLGLLGF